MLSLSNNYVYDGLIEEIIPKVIQEVYNFNLTKLPIMDESCCKKKKNHY